MYAATVEGKQVKVGDVVCFKSDVEQCGTITHIAPCWNKSHTLTLSSKYGFSGDYIGGETTTTVNSRDCW